MAQKRKQPLETSYQKAQRLMAEAEKQNEMDPKEIRRLTELRGTRVKYSIRKTIFINEYLSNGFNADAAVVKCGYALSSAPSAKSYFLRDPEILQAIENRKQEIRQRANITIDKLIFKLADIVDFDIADLYDGHGVMKPLHQMSKATRAAIAGIESEEIMAYDKLFGDKLKIGTNKKVKIVDRIRAIELLSKLLGYVDKLEVKTIDGGTSIQKNHEVIFQDNADTEDVEAEIS